jgi:PTS system mannitol-specific IIA component
MTKQILSEENIILDANFTSKEEAIRATGKILVDQGYVEPSYIDKMLEREELISTYMGNFVAIPHGTEDAKKSINTSGLAVIQVPAGVDFGDGNMVKILIGIAGKDGEHLDILSQIAIVCSDEENIEKIVNADSAKEIISLFYEVN